MTSVACATATSDPGADAGGRSLPEDEGSGGASKPDSGLEEADASPPHNDPPDAGAPPPPSCTTQTLNLLGNPNLDGGQGGGWLETSSGNYALIVNQSETDGVVSAHTVPFIAWLGGYADAVDSMSQEVAIPADATNVRVRGQRLVMSDEGGGVYDRSWLDITNSGGASLETLQQWSNQDETGGWVAFDVAVSGSYQGQTIRLRLRSDADDSLRTHFFYDSMSFDVTSCQ